MLIEIELPLLCALVMVLASTSTSRFIFPVQRAELSLLLVVLALIGLAFLSDDFCDIALLFARLGTFVCCRLLRTRLPVADDTFNLETPAVYRPNIGNFKYR